MGMRKIVDRIRAGVIGGSEKAMIGMLTASLSSFQIAGH